MNRAVAIIPAAGRGSRLGGSLPKQFLSLNGRTILEHTLAAFEHAVQIRSVILAVASDMRAVLADQLQPIFPKLLRVVVGGERRQDSVAAALAHVEAEANDIVVVHDAARPLIRPELIDESVRIAEEVGGCVVASPIHDTVKRVAIGEVIAETMDRSVLWCAQTPQSFRFAILREAMAQAMRDGVTGTDEASLVERLGVTVRVLRGDPWNLKITTREDLAIAEALMQSKQE